MKRKYDRISTYFKMNLHIVIPMCITALLFNALMCLLPVIEGQTINSLNSGSYSVVARLCLIFILLVLFVQINRFFKRYLVRVFGNKMTLTMRQVSLCQLLNKDISYFIHHNAGDILNKNLSDIYDTTEGIRKMTTECFDTFVLLGGYLITMLIMDWQISLVSILFIGLSILASHFMKRFVYKTNKAYKEYLSENKQIALTRLNNELYYRSFGVSEVYERDYEASLNELRKKSTKALVFQSSLEPLYSSIALAGVFFIIAMGGGKVIRGVYEIGVLSAFLTTYLLVAKKAARVGKVFNAYQGFKVSWQRCREYLHEEEITVCGKQPENTELTVREFSYGYPGGFKLPPLTFTASAGEIIGICGRVHTGKSTVLRALTGLYPYSGEACLGGVEVKELIHSPVQYIGYCAPEVSLFSDSLKNNIELHREGDLDRAIEVSALKDALSEIGGTEAMLSHTTANISGGQQKRLQMARALYPDTSLILLDDPFQSVNKELLGQMMSGLKGYSGQIILLASNQPVILRQTDKVIYLDGEKGYVDTYENLLKNEGFRELMEA